MEMLQSGQKILGGGNRVFIVPLCSSCNGQMATLQATIPTGIVHLIIYGINSQFDERAYAYEHEELSLDELRWAIVWERTNYTASLGRELPRQRTLHGRDKQVLEMAVPFLRSVPSSRF